VNLGSDLEQADRDGVDLRVALDVTPELVGTTGVARYSRELRQALERRNDCTILPFAIGRRSQEVPSGVRHVRAPLRIIHPMWRAFGVPRAEQIAGPVNIVHSLDLLPPPTRHPLVVTVHDLVTSELPGLHPARSRRMQRLQLAELNRAAAILAVSRSTADALAARGVGVNRIHVTPNGLSPFPASIDPPIPRERFFLLVGSLEPRKGHELLLQAAAKEGLEEVRIVFAGPELGRADHIRAVAAELGLGDRLILLGPVEDAVLAGLYRNATALCLPSYGEGFGLPVLEAMSFGTPVVASDLPALREVADNAALYVAPGDSDGLARELRRIAGDGALRERLARQGKARSTLFTWDATAEATLRAYRAALRR
jgi:glycosyltransferase involved in cell wall biosynthesis